MASKNTYIIFYIGYLYQNMKGFNESKINVYFGTLTLDHLMLPANFPSLPFSSL